MRSSTSGYHFMLRPESPARAVRTASYTYLPSMPPPLPVGAERSPQRRIHHLVERRSPTRAEVAAADFERRLSRERMGVVVPGPVAVSPMPMPPVSPILVRRLPPEHHQDVFISGLQVEVNELKQRHGDYGMLMDAYKVLEARYHDAVLEMQTMQVEYSGKIEKDRQEVDAFVNELDLVRAENATAEQDQMAILDSVAVVERDVYAACRELNDLRMQCTSLDLQNMDLKK